MNEFTCMGIVSTDEEAIQRWIGEGNPNCHDELPEWETPISGLNSKSAAAGDGIYDRLARHQVTTGTWRFSELATELHRWAGIFNELFGLQVSAIALRVDWLSVFKYGHFQPGHNGFGLQGEIAINERYLHQREPWEILGTVLHELLHAWQEEHGKPGRAPYHNKEFRAKALQLGLVIDEDGVTQYLAESPFKALLNTHGVQMPSQPAPPVRRRGNSKLKKWSCACAPKPVNVRVAIADFQARCLKCGGQFVRG